MRLRFMKFMQGRYGMDPFGRFILYFVCISLFINCFIHSEILYYLGVILLVYCYFRIFSKNIYKRAYENDKYVRIRDKIKCILSHIFCSSKCGYSSNNDCSKTEDNYKIFKCPSCKQKLRVPKGKGKIQISCCKCGNTFVKRT